MQLLVVVQTAPGGGLVGVSAPKGNRSDSGGRGGAISDFGVKTPRILAIKREVCCVLVHFLSVQNTFRSAVASGCRPLPTTWVSDLCARKVEFFERLLAEMQWSAMSLPARGLGTGPCFQLVTRHTIRLAARVNLSNGFKKDPWELSGDRFAWSDWGATCSGAESLSPLVHRKLIWAAKFAGPERLRSAARRGALGPEARNEAEFSVWCFWHPRYLTA